MNDFFDNHEGNAVNYMGMPKRAFVRDRIFDLLLALDPRQRKISHAMKTLPRQRILVVGVEVPSRGGALQRIAQQLASSRHDVTISTVPMQPKGKFENVDDAIAASGRPLAEFDWLIVTDDDVALPKDFTDRYIAAAQLADVAVSQPAHKFLSHTTYQITRRKRGHMVRQTQFVEIGPLTVIRKDAFEPLVPFPQSRWAYGIDVLWADISRRHGWKMGVVDACPIRHLRPVAGTYDMSEAIAEGRELLARHDVNLNRDQLLGPGVELITG